MPPGKPSLLAFQVALLCSGDFLSSVAAFGSKNCFCAHKTATWKALLGYGYAFRKCRKPGFTERGCRKWLCQTCHHSDRLSLIVFFGKYHKSVVTCLFRFPGSRLVRQVISVTIHISFDKKSKGIPRMPITAWMKIEAHFRHRLPLFMWQIVLENRKGAWRYAFFLFPLIRKDSFDKKK
jgi:hypothetical protein